MLHDPARRALRLFITLVTALLLPVAGGLAFAPAQAVSTAVSGGVVDDLGDPVGGVSVTALVAPDWSPVTSTTSDPGGGYQLALGAGTYRLRFDMPGYEQTFFAGGKGVVVDADRGVSVDGEPLQDNALGDVVLTSTSTHQVSGTVRNTEGAALQGITVEAFAPGETTDPVASTATSGSGAYVLEVRTGIYQVRYTDPSGVHLAQWYGGAEPEDVAVPADRTLDPVVLSRPAARFAVAGTVVDALGDPVAGVSVSVSGTGATTGTGTGTTGSDGTYAVQLLPGTYRVAFARTGFVPARLGGDASPSTVTVAADGTLSLAPAEVLVDNLLPDAVLRSTPYAVTGTVAADDGTPLTGITVRAFPEGSTDPADVVDTTTSDATGAYTLDLPVGAYDVEHVDADDVRPTYVSVSLAAVRVAQGGSLTVGGDPVASLPSTRLALSSADVPRPVVGSVVDLNGDPVDGLAVSAVPGGGGAAVTTTTGADGSLGLHGRYRLALVPGTYRIEVAGGTAWRDADYVGAGTAAAFVTVQLNGTVLVNGVEAVGGDLGPTSVAGRTTYALSGTVDDGHAPLPGITVTAHPEDDPTATAATTTTGAGGSWSLDGADGLTVGRYLVEMTGTIGDVSYERTWFGGATPTVVVITQDGTATVAGVPVTGNVLPVVTMTARPASVAHAVVGAVVDANHDPVVGGLVLAEPQGDTSPVQRAMTVTGAGGRYRLALRPGTYRVTLAADGFASAAYPGAGGAAVDVVVGLDGAVLAGTSPVASGDLGSTVLLDALRTGSVSGRVVDADGRSVTGTTVDVLRVADLAGVPVATTSTSGTGSWTVTGLPIGTYVLRFTDGTAPSVVRGPVKVGQGDVVSVDGVPVTDGATGDVVVPVAVVVPPVVAPPVVVPPVEPPVVEPPVVVPPVVPPVMPPVGAADQPAARAAAPVIWRAHSGARGGRSTATARWGFPSDDGGAAVTSYRVQVLRLSPSGDVARRSVRLTGPSAREMVLRLAPGTYRFRVAAVTEVGQSPWSALSRQVAAR